MARVPSIVYSKTTEVKMLFISSNWSNWSRFGQERPDKRHEGKQRSTINEGTMEH